MALSISQPVFLPERCVLFLTNAFSGGPIEAVPAGLRARFRIAGPTTPLKDVILGVLATDHAGYASWDLSPLVRRLRLELEAAQIHGGSAATIELDSLIIRLAGPLATEIDA